MKEKNLNESRGGKISYLQRTTIVITVHFYLETRQAQEAD